MTATTAKFTDNSLAPDLKIRPKPLHGAPHFPTVCLCPYCHGVAGCSSTDPDYPKTTHWKDRDLAHKWHLIEHGYLMGRQINVDAKGTHALNCPSSWEPRGKCDCACDHVWKRTGRYPHAYSGPEVVCTICGVTFVTPDSK